MKYVLFLMMVLFSSQAVALNCAQAPSCEELGYSTQNNPNCLDDGYLICPFDSDYKKCVNFNCESLGFTNNDKTSWCKNIATCPNNKDYTACIKATCEIGDVYYSDGSCGLVEDYNPNDKNKIPVGVVFYVSDGGYHGKVINLHDLGKESENAPFDPANPYNTESKLFWGYYSYDLQELPNYDNSNIVDKLKAYDEDLYDGQGNTDKILADSGPADCNYGNDTAEYYQYCVPQAAKAARDFYPLEELQEDSKVGQGKWYLPAIGELMELYGYDNSLITYYMGTTGQKGDHKTLVNNTLDTLRGKGVISEKLTNNYHWSSSEYSRNDSWRLGMGLGGRGNGTKNDYGYVRVSLQF